MAASKASAMGHTFHQLFYHFAWATHSRIALIHRDYRPGLLKIINEETKITPARTSRPLKGAEEKRENGFVAFSPQA
jgi:hypothetical protein